MKRPVPAQLLFLILCIASLLYTFPVYNKFWAPFDEGIIAVASQRLLAGEMPYKDFFIIMYPPGQVYVVALLYKIFPSPLIAGRIYTVFVSVGISVLVFYMTLLLTKKISISLLSWLVVLLSSAPRLGAIPAPIWPGVFLGLLALFTYMRYVVDLRNSRLVIAGIITGLAILFRHDIGIFAFVSILISLFMGFLYKKNRISQIMLFTACGLVVILPCVIYFITKSATRDMVESLVLFPFAHHPAAGLPFPKPCLDLSMIFHRSLYFIEINQYYIPILVYLFMLIYLLYEFFKGNFRYNKNPMITALFLFGIFTFRLVTIRTDPSHLLTVIQPSVIFFGFILHKTFRGKFNLKIGVLLRYAVSAVLVFLFVLLLIKNIDKYFKNTFRKIYKKDTVATTFDQGTIYVPKEERDDVLSTLDFIKKNTYPNERILVGNIAHWKDDFGGSLIIYFLADRLPSTKYYEFLPHVTTNPSVQREIKESLLKHDVNLVVLQDIDLGTLRKEDMPQEKLILDNFIGRDYKLVRKFGKYNIYLRQR